jgi:hypothetical protein
VYLVQWNNVVLREKKEQVLQCLSQKETLHLVARSVRGSKQMQLNAKVAFKGCGSYRMGAGTVRTLASDE